MNNTLIKHFVNTKNQIVIIIFFCVKWDQMESNDANSRKRIYIWNVRLRGKNWKTRFQEAVNTLFDITYGVKQYPLHLIRNMKLNSQRYLSLPI